MHASSGSNTWSTQTDHCCVGQFQYRVFKTIWLGWFWTSVLLISSYWLAMMTGISHSHQLWLGNFDLYDWSFPSADLKSCPSMPAFNCCYLFLLFISLLPFFLPSSYLFLLHSSNLFILLSLDKTTFYNLSALSRKYFFLQTGTYCKCDWFLSL
jgi:hypothetical protein